MSSSSSSSPCAACKFLRRKCTPECVFAPYFPADQPQRFASVHKVFGASNVAKILNDLDESRREDAVNSLAYEAETRLRDPVYGCVGVISILQHRLNHLQIDLELAKNELASIVGPTAMMQMGPSPYLQLSWNNNYNMAQQQQQQQHQQSMEAQEIMRSFEVQQNTQQQEVMRFNGEFGQMGTLGCGFDGGSYQQDQQPLLLLQQPQQSESESGPSDQLFHELHHHHHHPEGSGNDEEGRIGVHPSNC